ncbi:MAG: multiheme c-type cytochrome [Planctomycetota bacterium]
MIRRGHIVACVVAVVGLMVGALTACGEVNKSGESSAPPPPVVKLPAPPVGFDDGGLVVAWGAHGGARMEPCGCSAGMHGGLARRAALLQRIPVVRSLRLELGGWSGGNAPYQTLRAQHYLAAARDAGIAAIGIGLAEVRLGRTVLMSFTDERVVCANVQGMKASIAITKQGVRLIVTSVAPIGANGAGLTVTDPVEALNQIVAAAGGAKVVVMADLDADGLTKLARDVSGLALIIGGDGHQPSQRPLAVGPTRIVYAGNEGKTVGWWSWGSATCAFELADDQVPDLPSVREHIRAYQLAVAALDVIDDQHLSGLTALTSTEANTTYVGDAMCATCHVNAGKIHAATPHAHALQSLVKRGYAGDPDCLRCHVTGLGRADGYDRAGKRPEFDHVSCESCHGRGSKHAAERAAGRPEPSPSPVTPATCARCHDPENSPAFNYAVYWQRIHHGR